MSNKVKKVKTRVRFNKVTGLFAAAVISVAGVFTLLLSNAATPGTPPFGLYVSPSSLSPAAGSQFNVSVYANLGPNAVQSITAYLKYDPTKLRLDSADQAGVDPNFTVTSRCTAIGSCKPAGEIVFVAGYSGSSTITPADGILVGNLRFTALTTGAASLTFDADPRLSGFSSQNIPQATLDTRTLLSGAYNVTGSSGGGSTSGGGTSGGASGSTQTGGGTTAKPKSSTSTTTTKTTPKTGQSTSPSTTSSDTTAPTTDDTAAVGDEQTQSEATTLKPVPAEAATTKNSPLKTIGIALGSLAASFVIISSLALVFSASAREEFKHIFGLMHHGHAVTPDGSKVFVGGDSGGHNEVHTPDKMFSSTTSNYVLPTSSAPISPATSEPVVSPESSTKSPEPTVSPEPSVKPSESAASPGSSVTHESPVPPASSSTSTPKSTGPPKRQKPYDPGTIVSPDEQTKDF